MKKHTYTIAVAVLMALFTSTSFAEQNSQQPSDSSQQITIDMVDSVTGVSYELDENGEFARLRSTGRAELNFGDQQDIRVAISKAKMRAKADIAKFLTERVTSDELLDYTEKQMNSQTNQTSQISRESVQNYMEKIQNSAEAILKGIITTKTDVNKQEKYVEVEMGYSPKTQRIADTINNSLQSDLSNGNSMSNQQNSQSGNSIGREIKKSKNYDNF